MALRIFKTGVAFLGAVLLVLLGLRTLVWFGEQVPMIEPIGEPVTEGELTRTPIRFAQTDFWFYPPRVEAELGRLVVPTRRDHRDDAALSIRWVRFPATGADGNAPPTVYLAGGPGGSGIRTASGDRFRLFMTLREAGDVIALDQRGTFLPSPQCEERWRYPPDRTADEAVMREAHAAVLRACWAAWEERIHPDSFTTRESVADLEDLRLALGAEQLNLVGISYGTHLALAYLRAHPERVARAILAGVEGPDHTYKRPAVVDRVLRSIDARLAAEAGWVGLIDDLRSGAERLARETPQLSAPDPSTGEPVTVTLGPLDLLQAAHFGLGEREDLLRAARRIREIAEGDDERLAAWTVRRRIRPGPHLMPISMDCASGVSATRREQILTESPASILGPVVNLDLDTYCPHWPVTDLGEAWRAPVVSTVPVLAISGTLDLRTPPSNAEEALAGFSAASHLLLDGAGHGDDLLIGDRAIARAMVRFLQTGAAGTDRITFPPL